MQYCPARSETRQKEKDCSGFVWQTEVPLPCKHACRTHAIASFGVRCLSTDAEVDQLDARDAFSKLCAHRTKHAVRCLRCLQLFAKKNVEKKRKRLLLKFWSIRRNQLQAERGRWEGDDPSVNIKSLEAAAKHHEN